MAGPLLNEGTRAPSGRGGGTILIASLANVSPALTVSTLGMVLPEVRGTLSLSEVEAGALFSAIFVVASVASPSAGRLIDRVGSKAVLITGMGCLAFGFALAGLSPAYLITLPVLGLAGMGYGFTTPAIFALMSELLPGRRGLAVGLVSVSYGIGGLFGPVLSSAVTSVAGWRAAFLTVGLVGLALTALEGIGIRSTPGRRGASAPLSLRESVDRNLVLLACSELFAGSVFWSTISWGPTVLRDVKALGLGETAVVMGAWGTAPILGSLLLGRLSDTLGRKAVIISTAYPSAIVALVTYRFMSGPAALGSGLALFGFLNATFPALVVALAQDLARPGALGTASGLVMSTHYVSAFLAPVATGKLLASVDDILWGMVAVSSIPLVVYGSLVASVRGEGERRPAGS